LNLRQESAMATNLRPQASPFAEEFEVGDDSDLPGFDQPVTGDDIDALVSSGRATEQSKRAILMRMRDDLLTRRDMDEAGEFTDLIERIEAALSVLHGGADGAGTPSAYGFDAADRALQPDEILERAEAEREEEDALD
jgi:hypothetical protein